MIYYVKVIGGQIVDGPHQLTGDESQSPNVNWGPEQLALNNFILTDITFDPTTQKVDYSNPTITPTSVTFPIIQLADVDRIVAQNAKIDLLRQQAYPPVQDICVALWKQIVENNPQPAKDLQTLRLAVQAKYPKVNS